MTSAATIKKAYKLFTEKGCDAKEIAYLLAIEAAHVRNWIYQNKWKDARAIFWKDNAGLNVSALPDKPVSEPMESRQIKAQILFVEKGYSEKEIAGILSVKPAVVAKWIAAGSWSDQRDAKQQTNNEIDLSAYDDKPHIESAEQKQAKARYLIVVKGYTQKETSKLVGVSQKTMCFWVERFQWKETKGKAASIEGGFSVFMEGFVRFVKKKAPGVGKDVLKLWGAYLADIEKEVFS